MLPRTVTATVLVCAAMLTFAQETQAQQTLNFTIGGFVPLGQDARVPGDVLNENDDFLAFDVDDLRGASIGGEWLVPLGEFLEAGAGLSFSRQTVHSVYEDYIDTDGSEIEQDLRLRLIPVAFTVRLVPFGQRSPVQPYIGAGLGIINWRYSETGEFIDFGRGLEIFEDHTTYVASGSETGPIILGGIRFTGDRATAGGEIRYQKADTDLPNDFAGSKLDLGGWTYNFTIGVRF